MPLKDKGSSSATRQSSRVKKRTKRKIENDILETRMSLEICANDINDVINECKDCNFASDQLENFRDILQESVTDFEEHWHNLKIYLDELNESLSESDQEFYKLGCLNGQKHLKKIIRHIQGELSNIYDVDKSHASASKKGSVHTVANKSLVSKKSLAAKSDHDIASKKGSIKSKKSSESGKSFINDEKARLLADVAAETERIKSIEEKFLLEDKKREIERQIELQEHLANKRIAEKRYDILSQAGSVKNFNDDKSKISSLNDYKGNVLDLEDENIKPKNLNNFILQDNPNTDAPNKPAYDFPHNSTTFSPTVLPTSTNDSHVTSILAAAVQQLCTQQIEQNEKLCEMHEKHTIAATRSSIAKAEPPVFSGDVVKYPAWKCAFGALIHSKPISDCEKLFLLGKYTGSKTRQMIQTYISLGTSTAYRQALCLLDERYGNPTFIYEAFKEKLQAWPKITKAADIQDYYDFIQQLHDSMGSVDNLKMFDHISSIKEMVKKLPSYTYNDWQKTYETTLDSGNPITLKVFVQFMKKVSRRAVDPIFSREALTGSKESIKPKETKKVSYDVVAESEKSESKKYHCLFCKKDNHEISRCIALSKKPHKEINDFFVNEKLCYSCGKKNHVSKNCLYKKTCNVCKLHHLTVFHDKNTESAESAEKKGEVNYSATYSSIDGPETKSLVALQPIVLVYLYSADEPEKRIKTYALIDGGSNVCFVSKSLLESLNLKGQPANLKLNTVHGTKVEHTWVVQNLICKGVNEDTEVKMPSTFVQKELPMSRNSIPCHENVKQLEHLKDIANEIPPYTKEGVGLIIGTNCPKGTFVQEIRSGEENMPQALKYILGWTVQGPAYNIEIDSYFVSHKIQASVIGESNDIRKEFVFPVTGKEIFNPYDVARLLDVEYRDSVHQEKSPSIEDKQFMEIVGKSINLVDGHFEIPLPLRENVSMPNNRSYVFHRYISILKKLKKDHDYHEKYTKFMEDMIAEGHAELVPKDILSKKNEQLQRVWYIPHFGVVNPRKPEKTRVVFDCAAKFHNVCLNDKLLQGPDLTSSLLGVLLRFRLEPVAFMADIKSMFHQVRVNQEDRDFLRFFWNAKGNLDTQPSEYRMAVHLFGAVSSPSCSNYALRKCTELENFGSSHLDVAKHSILRNMYVDDLIKSVDSVATAKAVISDVLKICKSGGFELNKFHFNNSELTKFVPSDLHAKDAENISLKEHSEKLLERALGVHWCVKDDVFGFCITDRECTPSRRGILSLISSVYDPLGFCSPVILVGKRVLQNICKLSTTKLDWDSPVPETELKVWHLWKNNLTKLNSLSIDRCYKPIGFGDLTSVQMHHFCDAAPGLGLGQASYLRLIDVNGNIHCSLLMSKSRVPPLKTVTVPRLELNACAQAVRLAHSLNKELKGEFGNHAIENIFWTDSKIALGYISNESTRFKTFVANRVEEIRELSQPSQWHHVNTNDNPADHCSRGTSIDKLLRSNFYQGPGFLWKPFNLCDDSMQEIDKSDPELKNTFVCITKDDGLMTSLENISSWEKIKRIVSFLLRWKNKDSLLMLRDVTHTVDELRSAEKKILWMAQKKYFLDAETPLCQIDSHGNLKIYDKTLAKLDPFLSDDGLIRVGGRLRNTTMNFDVKYPVLISRHCKITKSIVLHYHTKVFHQGRGLTVNEIRQNGFWIFGGSRFVAGIISKCVTCRKLRGSTSTQKMADLPKDRIEEESPCFTYCGCDYFGPFYIKERRSELKRYGCLFTCLVSRAIHIEVAPTLETSSFINCLRRFLCRRGPVRHIRCDQGTNFIGCSNELKSMVGDLDHDKIRQYLLENKCDWVEFKFNSPVSSHMGGAWERMIRTVRSILNAMLKSNGPLLDNDGLLTFMCEVEAIVNSRPLTEIDSSTILEPLTPNHLLTGKTKVILSPPSKFISADMYARKKWRHVQYLANQFWTRFRSEYLLQLQKRNKWHNFKRNFQVGDIVLLKDEDAPRNTWKLARVVETFTDDLGTVRKVKIQCSTRNLDKKGCRTFALTVLERPIHKLVLLTESNE